MPLVTQLREGVHPLVLPRDLSIKAENNMKCSMNSTMSPPSPNGCGGSPSGMGSGGFSCSDCGRLYKLKSSLRNHQKWECGKEPQFQCPYCVYRAKQKMHIGRHMERMHKERFFKVESDKVIALDEDIKMTHEEMKMAHVRADEDEVVDDGATCMERAY